MIKASEGGGGKGIRKVESAQGFQNAYSAVCGEVPGMLSLNQTSRAIRRISVQVHPFSS